MWGIVRVTVAATLIASTGHVAAAPSDPLRLQPTGKWEVNYDDYRCELRRVMAAPDGTPYLLSLPLEPLNDVAKLRLTHKEKPSRRQEGDASVTIDGQAQGRFAPVKVFSNSDLRTRQYTLNLGHHALARAQANLAFKGTGGDVEVGVDQLPAAWRAASSCLGGLAKEVGIDPAMLQAVKTPPQGRLMDFVHHPGSGSDLQFVVVYWVNTDGRVDDCRLIKASGRQPFDEAICKRLLTWGRFKPAIGADGNPMRAPRYDNIQISRFFLIFEDAPGDGHRIGD